jgi:threonine/homoserine/homoserine lactone efflux protein
MSVAAGVDLLWSFAALWLIAVITPGPNMLFFTSVALSSPRRALAAAGIGIVLGTAAWGFAGLLGLLWLFETFPALAAAVKILGGLYLAWIGFRIVRTSAAGAATEHAAVRNAAPLTARRAFSLGLAVNLSNPKSLVFVTSIFAVTRLAEAPLTIGLLGVVVMVAMSVAYYTAYGVILTATRFAEGEGRLKRLVGLVVGAAMMVFGARMAWER